MAVSINHLTHGDGGGSSLVSPSISPLPNTILLLLVYNKLDPSGGNTPTASGLGLTWTNVGTITSGKVKMTLFRALTGASPGSGAVTMDYGGQSQQNTNYSIDNIIGSKITGVNGADALVQVGTNNSSGSQTTFSVSLSSFVRTDNLAYGGMGFDGSSLINVGSGSSLIFDAKTTLGAGAFNVESEVNTPNINWSFGTANSLFVGIAVEIAVGIGSASISPSISPSRSGSASASRSASRSVSPSHSLSPSSSHSPSSSASASPSQDYAGYTRKESVVLPTDDADLTTVYTAQEVRDVSLYDGAKVGQMGTLTYMVHQFKNFIDEDQCTALYKGQSTLAPALSPVYLEIYNRATLRWETLDSNNSADANTNFRLAGDISDLTNYKDSDSVISCRVWQAAI